MNSVEPYRPRSIEKAPEIVLSGVSASMLKQITNELAELRLALNAQAPSRLEEELRDSQAANTKLRKELEAAHSATAHARHVAHFLYTSSPAQILQTEHSIDDLDFFEADDGWVPSQNPRTNSQVEDDEIPF